MVENGESRQDKATQPEKTPDLPSARYKLEEIKSLGPNLDNLDIGRRGMAFAATYLMFWEMHKSFTEEIRETGQLTKDVKEITASAKKHAATRFAQIYGLKTPEDLKNPRDFFGYLFQINSINGVNLFTEWLETPEAHIEALTGAYLFQLRKTVASAGSEATT